MSYDKDDNEESLKPDNATDASSTASSKPRLLLMGLKRSGKSSISNVVFRKMAPQDTLFLETTTKIQKEDMHSFMDFQVWDLPGQMDFLDPSFDTDEVFGGVGAMVWVLDAIDNYLEPIGRLTETILHLSRMYPQIKYTVFIHKTDSLTEDFQEDTIRDITQRINDDLYDAGMENPPISFYGTSIYDHSIYDAFSKVMQTLVPQLPTFESLLTTIYSTCHFEKVYLFDVYSKIYIASDTNPSDGKSYELCSDYIDIIVDMSEVYGWPQKHGEKDKHEVKRREIMSSKTAESFVSHIKGNHLYLREINRTLAFIGVSRDSKFEQSRSLIDENLQLFQDQVLKVLEEDER